MQKWSICNHIYCSERYLSWSSHCCPLCVVIGIQLSILVSSYWVFWWCEKFCMCQKVDGGSHSEFTWRYLWQQVCINVAHFSRLPSQAETCYWCSDTCCKVITTCSQGVGLVDQIVCALPERWYTGSISVEVTAHCNLGPVCPSPLLSWIIFHHLPLMKHCYAYKSEDKLETIRSIYASILSSNYLVCLIPRHLH